MPRALCLEVAAKVVARFLDAWGRTAALTLEERVIDRYSVVRETVKAQAAPRRHHGPSAAHLVGASLVARVPLRSDLRKPPCERLARRGAMAAAEHVDGMFGAQW